ncbi:MAG TPA: HepT-like ribonuclease domain-containing protein [Terrimicrobiaceae bacterium]
MAHIVEAADRIAEYLQGISKESFLTDVLRQDAVIRRIQIIGEAVRHLSPALLITMPGFPAKEAKGMRNVLVHDYEGVNVERIWDTAIKDIPVLRQSVEEHLRLHAQRQGRGLSM